MTKKDFELIANTLRYCDMHCDNDDETDIVRWVSGHLANALATTNPRFDVMRFLAQSMIES